MDWKECKIKKLVKETRPDNKFLESLRVQSEKKLKTAKRLETDEVTASTKFCDFYDSVRILLEAVALKNSLKIYNHECYKGFLGEVLGLTDVSLKFDKLRKIRNGINYYGEDLSPLDANNFISTLIEIRKQLEELL